MWLIGGLVMSMVNQSILLKWIILMKQTCIETVCSVSDLQCTLSVRNGIL